MASVTQPVYIRGRKAAVLRNGGSLCDIRRKSTGFLYDRGRIRVAVNEELLEQLGDSVVLQFTNMSTRDIWTCTVRDFRRWSEPVQFGGFEPQRAAEVSRMAHRGGRKPGRNEPIHIENEPARRPQASQLGLFG